MKMTPRTYGSERKQIWKQGQEEEMQQQVQQTGAFTENVHLCSAIIWIDQHLVDSQKGANRRKEKFDSKLKRGVEDLAQCQVPSTHMDGNLNQTLIKSICH